MRYYKVYIDNVFDEKSLTSFKQKTIQLIVTNDNNSDETLIKYLDRYEFSAFEAISENEFKRLQNIYKIKKIGDNQ